MPGRHPGMLVNDPLKVKGKGIPGGIFTLEQSSMTSMSSNPGYGLKVLQYLICQPSK